LLKLFETGGDVPDTNYIFMVRRGDGVKWDKTKKTRRRRIETRECGVLYEAKRGSNYTTHSPNKKRR
jgi:hypothetical protein